MFEIFTLPIFLFENERLIEITLADIAISGLNSLSATSAICPIKTFDPTKSNSTS